MIRQVQVYELSVPPRADTVSFLFYRGHLQSTHTSVIYYPPLCPVLENHSNRSHTLVNLNISLDHACVLQRERIVYVQITRKLQLRIPHFHDGNFGMRDAHDLLHSVYGSSASYHGSNSGGVNLRSASTLASAHVSLSFVVGVVTQTSTVQCQQAAGCARGCAEPTIRIISIQHVTGRSKHVHFYVATRPLLVEKSFELMNELSASFHAFWSRYEVVVELSDVVSESPLILGVKRFLRCDDCLFEQICPHRVGHTPFGKGHPSFELTTSCWRPSS